MNIDILRKQDLTKEQLIHIDERISMDCHKHDTGPCSCWNTYANGLYAAIDKGSSDVVALIEASGPVHAVNPGWWIDSKFREKGYGSAVVVKLARYLKGQGYMGIGNIRVQSYHQQYDQASQRLKEKFVNEFKSS